MELSKYTISYVREVSSTKGRLRSRMDERVYLPSVIEEEDVSDFIYDMLAERESMVLRNPDIITTVTFRELTITPEN